MGRRLLTLAALAFLAGATSADVHPRAGTTSLAFLKLGAGARYAALADAGAALADDAFAGYWNPAQLGRMSAKHSLGFQHTVWIEGTSIDEIYYAAALGKHRLGLSSRLFSVGDIPMRGDIPTEEPIATYQAYDFFAGLSYAYSPSRNLSAGITYRRVYEKIYLDAAYAHNLSAGIAVNLDRPKLTLAATADNIGTRIKYVRYYYKQPTTFTLAGAWRLPWDYRQLAYIVAAELAKPVDDYWQARLGWEACWRNMLALRAGYKAEHSTEGFSAGMGFSWKMYRLDYAFVPHKYQLGTSHRFSLGLGF